MLWVLSMFQAIERALPGQCFAPILGTTTILARGILFPAQHCQQWIQTKLIVIIEIFVPQRQAQHPLRTQFLDRVFNKRRIAMVMEASGQIPQPSPLMLDFLEKKSSSVAANIPSPEISHNSTPTKSLKLKLFFVTLCHEKSLFCSLFNLLRYNILYSTGRLFSIPMVRNAG
jgi:hypothetical protein